MSFGQQLFVLAATVIGAYFGGPVGAVAASMLANALWAPEAEGPRLDDLKAQSSEYGRPIPIVYSIAAMQGNVIWASDLEDHESTVGGGILGGGTTIHTYFSNFAVMICESDGDMSLGRIWAGPEKRLVYDPAGPVVESGTVTFYNGAADQLPDQLMESHLGVGNVPAYRGRAVIVWEDFNVSDHDGNRIPFLTIEVGKAGSLAPPTLGATVWFDHMVDGGDCYILRCSGSYDGILQYDKNWSLMANRPFGSGFIDCIIYDQSRDKAVILNRGKFTDYTVLHMATGSETAASTGYPYVTETQAGVIMQGDQYIFAYKVDAGGSKLYYVDPDSLVVTATQTIDAGGASVAWIYNGGDDSPYSWCWAFLDDGTVVQFELDGVTATSTPVGTAPPGFSGKGSAAYNPYTSTLWAVGWSGGDLHWAQYGNSQTTSESISSSPIWQFGVPPDPWTFAPTRVFISGEQPVAMDWHIEVDATTGVLVDSRVGVYHGPNDIYGIKYNEVLGVVNAIRQGGALAIATDATPWTLPRFTEMLGGSDAGLEYQTLAEVVTDLSLRAGLTEADIDVTELTDQVDGYALANQMTVQAAVKALMPVYYFDAYEDQGIVVYRKRGGAMAVEVPDDDLGAAAAGASDDSAKDLVQITRKMDEEMPETFTVGYLLAATSYDTATKYARRLIGNSGNEAAMQLPMVLTDQKAAEVAQVNLMVQWTERLAYQFKLPREYAYLSPTDVIGVHGHVVRLTKIVQKDGVFECEAVRDDAYSYTPTVVVTETSPDEDTAVTTSSLTLMEMM